MMPPDFPARYQALLRRRNGRWIAAGRSRRALELTVGFIAFCLLTLPFAALLTAWEWTDYVALATVIAAGAVGVTGLRLRRPTVDTGVDAALHADRYEDAMRRVETEARTYDAYRLRVASCQKTATALGAAGLFLALCAH